MKNLKFKDYEYKRPNLEELEKIIRQQMAYLTDKHTAEEQLKAYHKIDELLQEMSSYATIASIRNSINTKDEFYEEERKFYNQEMPKFSAVMAEVSKLLVNSKHREELEKELGTLMFLQTELSLKTFDPKIIPELQKENELATEYSKLIASAEIEFDGETRNLSQMSPYTQHKDKKVRKKAHLAVSKFFEENEKEFDRIYDGLVKVRHEMALKLGYENYVQLGYDRMGRLDYNKDDVKNYRDQIYESVVPVRQDLQARKAKRLGIKDPKTYDLSISFLSGNPTPKGDRDWLVARAKKMYDEMSKETSEFFNFMLDHELMDLDSKPGKRSGGYCTFIDKYNSPFIFANFNGTSHDVDVLTHEAGHAFQVYTSRDLMSAYRWPTMEAAEIHSMSMEFFAWPWIDSFFLDDGDKYRYFHLAGAINFLPYGVAVDEFQHFVYENPEATPDERKRAWRKIEKKYLPDIDYGEDKFMDKGTYWFRQGHIFSSPFYYIDYTLAQIVAFQFWIRNRENHEKAWKVYYELCQLGGSKTFLGLLDEVGLENPFETGTVAKIIKPLKEYLDSVDDTKF